MPKKVITLKDKYKSTTFIYPKQIQQSLPSDIQPVVPEPESYTPTGEEPVAQYITIGDTVYKFEGGTDVVANPILAGTEADLTGLQIGDTKYKIPTGSTTHKYLVHVEIYRVGYGSIYFTVLKDDITNFTMETLIQKFIALGITSTGYIGATGYWYNNGYNNILGIGYGYDSELQSNVFRCEALKPDHTHFELRIPVDNNLSLSSIRKEQIY